MDKSARFWNAIANFYSKQEISDQATYEKKLAQTQSYFKPHMQVLEFGCGTGSTALIHAPFVQHIHAIDYSQSMIEIANQKAKTGQVNNVRFECREIMTLDEQQQYDVVLGLNVIHLIEDWESAIAKVQILLKPGGVFVSSTPCITGIWRIFKAFLPISKLTGVLPVLSTFSKEELEECIRNNGFAIDFRMDPGKNKALFLVARKNT